MSEPTFHPDYDANPLGPIPRPLAQEDTMSALNNLFDSTQDTTSYSDLPIDPSLTNATADLPTSHHHGHNLDPNLESLDQDDNQDLPTPVDEHNQNQNPPLKRKATSRASMLARGGACEFCKRRKLKCTAELPSCAACSRAGKECVYSQKKQRSKVRLLEDRLVELEKRLDGSVTSTDIISAGGGPYITPNSDSSPSVLQQFATPGVDTSSYWMTSSTPDMGFTFDTFDPVVPAKGTEPDLMTLADAAAADGVVPTPRAVAGEYPWEGMTVEAIVAEIVKAVEGGKGVGEKIVAHLLQYYLSPPSLPLIHSAVQPSMLLTRLAPNSPSPPHPALILSLLPYLLPLSPSAALSNPTRIPQIAHLLLPPGRLHSSLAIANADPRLLDIIAANSIRARTLYSESRFLEGWAESGSGAALCWCTGLGKLGGVGERFVESNQEMNLEILERERRTRLLRPKGAVVEQPKSAKELGARIDLFWEAYIADRGAAIGWGWASAFTDDEVTTPWPKENYEDPTSLLDNRSVKDFMDPDTPASGAEDSMDTRRYKVITLIYHVTRLYDQSPPVPDREKTARLMKIARGYMATLPVFSNMPTGQSESGVDPMNEIWMGLHCSMMLLHAIEEIDAASPKEAALLLGKSIESAKSVLERTTISLATGNGSLEGVDLCSVVTWGVVGRFVIKTRARLAGIPSEASRNEELDWMRDEILRALAVLGKRLKFALVHFHLLENVSLGVDAKVGEFARLDYLPV